LSTGTSRRYVSYPEEPQSIRRRGFEVKSAATVVQMLIRLTGLLLIVMGVSFWSGHALTLIPMHKQVGYLFVLSLWALAALAARAGIAPGVVVVAFLWGILVSVLGMTQDRLVIGDAHWIIKLLHLLVGLGAMGLAEGMGARIKAAGTPALSTR
jgi:hypothetical protein